jgi:predicted phage terminase large subunit-like protein
MATINNEDLQAFVRRDYTLFIERSFSELNPQTEYLHNWHIEVIAEALEQCRVGKLKRLIVNVPPRSLKSHMASIAFPAYLLGHNPSTQIICASYAQDLADKLAGDCRSLMVSNWYQGLFPSTRLASRRPMLNDFMTTNKGFRLSTSVGGVLTGRGADFIIVDDPLKPDEALSETQRNAVNNWFDHTLVSRLNDKRTGCIIVVMQRLHQDDLVGHILQQGDWHLLKFPAIAEENERTTIPTPYGERSFTRLEGEALHPARESLELLTRMREIQGEYHFAGQYQQNPSPLGGGMIRIAWFKIYTPADLPKEFELVLQSWDTANKSSELNDYSVCTTWGMREKELYLLHVYRKRLDYPELRRVVKQHAVSYQAKNILIEDKASGTQLIQDLQADGVDGTTRYESQMDKIMRMHSVSSTIENGFVHIPAQADWLPEYMHEIASFPRGKFDDQVDSTSQALDWVKQGKECYGVLDLRKKLIAQMGGRTALVDTQQHPGWTGAYPINSNGPQDVRKLKTDQRPETFPESRPCENCNRVMTQRIPGGLRCAQCGAQWLHPNARPRIPYLSRADIFNGRYGYG